MKPFRNPIPSALTKVIRSITLHPPISLPATLVSALLLWASFPTSLQAGDILKNNNTTGLNQAGSWVGPSAPGAGDVAVWESTVSNPNNCTNNPGGDLTWGGIKILNPAANVHINEGSPVRTYSIGEFGINLNDPASSQDLTVGPNLRVIADQTWAMAPGRVLIFNRQLDVQNGAVLTLADPVNLEAGNTANSVLRVGVTAAGGVVNQSAGRVRLQRGSSTDALLIGQIALNPGVVATYNISGGLLDASGYFIKVGNVTDAPGALNVTGTGQVLAGTLRVASQNSGTDSSLLIADAGQVFINELYIGLRSIGTLTIANDAQVASTNVFQLAGSSGSIIGSGYANLGGGTFAIPGITRGGGTGEAVFRFNGGQLVLIADSAVFAQAGIVLEVQEGGAKIDTGTFTVMNSEPLVNGTGGNADGGLVKSGSGTLVLAGANTYNGATLVSAGKLDLSTAHQGGGAITVADNATLGISVAAAGSTLACSSLTLGGAFGAVCDFQLGAFGNPVAPVVYATNLAPNGTVTLNITGLGFSIGQFALIQYEGAIQGDGFGAFQLGPLPTGVVASLVNNPNGSVDLQIDAAPFLVWSGATDGKWDINTTQNWIDPINGNIPAVYIDGTTVTFDDSATNVTAIDIPAEVAPGGLNLSNTTLSYSFSGPGVISGGGRLVKEGTGLVVMNTANTYAGNTRISEGTLQLGVDNAIPGGAGKGDLLLDGTLDLNGFNESINGLSGSGLVDNTTATAVTLTAGGGDAGGLFTGVVQNSGGGTVALAKTGAGVLTLAGPNTHAGGTTIAGGWLAIGSDQALGTGPVTLSGGSISSADDTARVVANDLVQSAAFTVGQDVTNGAFTFTGNVDYTDNNRTLTLNSDAVFTGNLGNGGLNNKQGPGTLTLQGTVNWSRSGGPVDHQLKSGDIVVDGATMNLDGAIRVMNQDNGGTSQFTIQNGGSVLITRNSANVRVGYTAGLLSSTNVVNVAGTFSMTTGGNGGRVQLGTDCARAIVNLMTGGVLETLAIEHLANASEFNFDGGTLRPLALDYAATFMQGLTQANVRDGGAIVDTAGYDITIAQDLLAGGTGGLTKTGAGSLTLLGNNNYTGPTGVSEGLLRLRTTHAGNGAFTVNDAATLSIEAPNVGDFLNVSDLTFGTDGSAAASLNLSYRNSTNPVIRAVNVRLNTQVLINITSAGLTPGQFPLIQYTGTSEGSGFFDLGTVPPGVSAQIIENPLDQTVYLDVQQVNPIVWTGSFSSDWDINLTQNWFDPVAALAAVYLEANGAGYATVFGDQATEATNINLTVPVAPGGISVTSVVNSYTFAGAGRLTGPTGIVKDGPSTLFLNTANDFTGTIRVQGGILVAGNAAALGTVDNGVIVSDGATLDINGQDLGFEAIAISGAGFNGAGAINNSGAQQQSALRYLTLAGDATLGASGQRWDISNLDGNGGALAGNGRALAKVGTFDIWLKGIGATDLGAIDIREGTLGFQADIDMGNPAATLTVWPGATLGSWANNNSATPFDKIVVMTNATWRNNSGDNYFVGTLTLYEANTFNIANPATLTLSGAISGPGSLVKTDASSLFLMADNDYAGGTTINGGRVRIGHDNALGTGPLTFGASGTALQVVGGNRILNNVIGSVTSSGNIEINTTGGALTLANEWTINELDVRIYGGQPVRFVSSSPSRLTGNSGFDLYEGSIVMDGNLFTNESDGVRLRANIGQTVSTVITNNATWVMGTVGGNPNFRLGNQANWAGTNELHISSGQLIVEVSGNELIVGDAANTIGMVYQTGGEIVWRNNTKNPTGVLIGNAAGTLGHYYLDGGTLETPRIRQGSGEGQIYLNGGTLKPSSAQYASSFLEGLTQASVRDGGVVIDTAGYDITVNQALLAEGTGGLTKNGPGTLTLNGANTYTGPTAVNEGGLVVSTAPSGGGTLSSAAGTLLGFAAVPGQTFNASAVSVGGPAQTSALEFDLGVNATPAVPLVAAGDVTFNGTVNVNIRGSNLLGTNFAAGQQIRLMTYSTLGGDGAAALNLVGMPKGVSGYLSNNVDGSSIDLVISGAAGGLLWKGTDNAWWDINGTPNWINLADSTPGVYREYADFGDSVLMNDNSFEKDVLVTTDVRPLDITVDSTMEYILGGPGGIGGIASIVKNGPAALVLNNNNTYSGGTFLNNGAVRVGHDNALGVGPVQMTGGTRLAAQGTDPRVIANDLQLGGNVYLGDASNPGMLTLSGTLDLGGAARSLTIDSDTLLSGSSNGVLTKLGPGILTLQGVHLWNGDSEIQDGLMIVDGAAVTNYGPLRPDCVVPNGLARLLVTNGAMLVYTNPGSNLRVGYDGDTTATNVVDIAGVVRIPYANDTSGQLILSRANTIGIANLLNGGDIEVRNIRRDGTDGYAEVNFDGGIVRAVTNNATFMEGLDLTTVKDGGVTFDTAGHDIAIAQALTANGAGGLTKTGLGTLLLSGVNTYTGITRVIEGALGGTGVVAGPLEVLANGTLAPGAGIGSFTASGTVSLAGQTVLEIDRDAPQNSDLLAGVTTLTLGGTLVVTNLGAQLAVGDAFNLFDAAQIDGEFAALQLPPLPAGLGWDTDNLSLDGTIQVVTVPVVPPEFASPSLSGTNLVLSGSGGVPGSDYYLLSSTNVALPVLNWTIEATNQFDVNGNFAVTNGIDPADLRKFFQIRLP